MDTAPTGPVRRYLPLAALAGALGLFFLLGLHRQLSLEALAEHRERLLALADRNAALAAAGFVAAYAAAVAASLPGAAVLTLAGGFLFGTWLGGLLAAIGATLGAVALFLAARSALGRGLRRRAGPWLDRFADGFGRDAFFYLLALRLIPAFPFWLVNLVPALLGVPLRTYVLATLIGIVPGTFVYASAGSGLGGLLASGGTPDLSALLGPDILLPLLGLSALALLPVVYRRFRKDRHG
jgi:uncharacterized membrane protein YdjX (TVP38/TMEM64 family)